MKLNSTWSHKAYPSARLLRIVLLLFPVLFAVIGSSTAHAFTFESLLSPGELASAHKKFDEQCDKCHQEDKSKQTRNCLACHKDIAKDVKNKQGFHGKKPGISGGECKICHSDHRGRDFTLVQFNLTSFDHRHTDFKLKGHHQNITCNACHQSGKKWREAQHLCNDCHEKQDPHKGKLGTKCQKCHSESGWRKMDFDHQKTDFPLHGKHRKVTCSQCHLDQKFKKTPNTCIACHQVKDAHQGRFGKKCDSCHSEKSWTRVNFDHTKRTDFKLRGKHQKLECNQCHLPSQSTLKIKTDCISCHLNDDVHFGKRGMDCASCHNNNRWSKTAFKHDKTRFPLRGKHKKLSCSNCHKGDVHQPLGSGECISCHRNDDPHGGDLGKQCQQCHNDKGWQTGIVFDHDLTKFPLLGMHAAITCENCHLDQHYKDTPMTCNKCHQEADYHQQSLGQKCSQCHQSASWSIWHFNHDTQTDFNLEGKHENLQCQACHQGPLDKQHLSGEQCGNCHQQEDIHRGEFGNFCGQCHNSDDFSKVEMR